MTVLLSIDPGRRTLGWASYRGGRLEEAGLAIADRDDLPTAARELAAAVRVPAGLERVVIERMRIYPGPQQRGDQNDLLDLAFVGGFLAGRVVPVRVELVTAHEWKGTVPKDVMHRRIDEALDAAEGTTLGKCLERVAKSLRHNVKDAVGIGLHALGRLGR